MKILIALIVSLLVGFFTGREVEHRHAVGEANKIGAQMIENDEWFDQDRAETDLEAIQLIQSGSESNAVHALSRSVRFYYRQHIDLKDKNEQTVKLLTLIDAAAKTNAILSDEVYKKFRSDK